MFNNCLSLEDISNFENWNLKNVKSFDFIFTGCISLSSIPDILIWQIFKNNKDNNSISLIN